MPAGDRDWHQSILHEYNYHYFANRKIQGSLLVGRDKDASFLKLSKKVPYLKNGIMPKLSLSRYMCIIIEQTSRVGP